MDTRYFTKNDFNAGYDKEQSTVYDVYEQRIKSGIQEYSLATYDFVFVSDKKEKLERLGSFLSENCGYKVNPATAGDGYWELTGDAVEFPVDRKNLLYWAIALYDKGYEFDCRLDGYGAMGDPKDQRFPEMESGMDDHYFDLAMDAFNKGDLGMSIIHFTTAIRINPSDPNSWYSRACVKDKLRTWKAARLDYDKAIELAPKFTDAIINRAANKDEAGEYEDAVADYTKVIQIAPNDAMAYFNRGNSKLNMKDKKGACEDWNKAKELGADYAQERITKHCVSPTFQQKIMGFFGKGSR